MDGDFDLVLTEYYGNQLQERVQKYIIRNYYREQPVGTSFSINTNKDNQLLIHTPTMRTSNAIIDKTIVYQAMRITLKEAYEKGVKNIVISMFGGEAGCCHPQDIAKLMRMAYDQLKDILDKINWDYAYKIQIDRL